MSLKRTVLFLSVLLLLIQPSPSFGGESLKHTPSEKTPGKIVRYVDDAVQLILRLGEKKAFLVLTDPDGPWVDGEWYLFASHFDGYIIAHLNEKLVGKSFHGVRDVKGKAFFAELQRIAQSSEGKGWSEYWWPRAGSNMPERKFSYVMRVPGKKIWIGTGAYGMDSAEIENFFNK